MSGALVLTGILLILFLVRLIKTERFTKELLLALLAGIVLIVGGYLYKQL